MRTPLQKQRFEERQRLARPSWFEGDAACCASSSDLPTPYPSGAWDRSDYVREYAKRVEELRKATDALKGVEALVSMTDTRGWISHDQRLALLGNIRSATPPKQTNSPL